MSPLPASNEAACGWTPHTTSCSQSRETRRDSLAARGDGRSEQVGGDAPNLGRGESARSSERVVVPDGPELRRSKGTGYSKQVGADAPNLGRSEWAARSSERVVVPDR